jgi:glycosyltransferase involved in cell wall biosynthesis/ubiquinone/menaquinone biosynthesis C-methylase UbiE
MSKQKVGLGIGIITRGPVDIKWAMHLKMLEAHLPIGIFWKYIVVEGKGWAEGREEVVRRAQKENFQHLLFIDDDVFLPQTAVTQMLSHGKDIVTGVYWTKSENTCPVIFEEFGKGPMFTFPVDSLFKIAGSGLGACVINMDVFDKFDEAGIPYFKENWIMKTDAGQNMKCPVGEDHYFFYHARKLGYDVWCDSGVLCDHYDVNKKKFYPPPEVVRKITSQKLIDSGLSEEVVKINRALGLDNARKTIAFLDGGDFNGSHLSNRAMGGSETALINISRLLSRDYNVHVYNNTTERGVFDNVIYHNFSDGPISSDYVIVNRFLDILGNVPITAKKVFLWAHDVSDSIAYKNLETHYDKLTGIIVLSEWHKQNFIEKFPFIHEDKFIILRNGVSTELFSGPVDKVPGRLIYSSTPYRGLEILAEVFPEIKKRVPHATLRVFSSMKLYGKGYDDNEYEWLYDKLRSLDGVEYFGSVPQQRLAKEMLAAEVLVYPNTYPETFCITALEAYAAKTPIVTSHYAGLKSLSEVIGDAGVFLKGNPYSAEYKQSFIDAVVSILQNEQTFVWNKDFSWAKVIPDWKRLFDDVDSIYKQGNINTPEYWDNIYTREIMEGKERVNTVANNFVLRYVKDGNKILDIGCGTGALTRALRAQLPRSEIWGSDFSLSAIDYCRQRDKTIYYTNHPLLNDDFEEHYFDVITIFHVLEHLDNPSEMILGAQRLLKKDGALIIALPLNDDDWREHQKVWHLNDIEEMLRGFDCEYTITRLFTTLGEEYAKYNDGRRFEQAFVVVKFNGGLGK